MLPANSRTLYVAALVVGLCMLGGALYVQYMARVEPSSLCILQRIWVLAGMLVCFIAALHGPAASRQRVYSLLVLFLSVGGALTTIWQLYLQDLPDNQVTDCLPGLEPILASLPLQGLVRLVLQGNADCAEVSWSLFGLSLPEWSLLGFIALAVLMAWPLLQRR